MKRRLLSLALVVSMLLPVLAPLAQAEAFWQCGQEAHTHEGSCKTQGYVCGQEAEEDHAHDDGCYETQTVLICEIHVHEDSCLGEVLTCELEEHTHSDACQCTCETLCAGEGVSTDCPVCAAEGADLSVCQGEVPVILCAHNEEAGCPVCAVEQAIETLPTAEQWLALTDADQRLEIYSAAQTVADQFNALTEEQQGMVTNFAKLMALHEAFNQQTAPVEGSATSGTCGADLTWTYADGVLTISGTGEMTDCPWVNADYKQSVTELILPEGLTSICTGAFYNFNGLTSVSIPDSVTMMGGNIFKDCANLSSVKVSAGWTSSNTSFYGCNGLKTITIPAGMTVLPALAFAHVTGLERIVIPEGVTTIGSQAFEGCTSLASVTFPSTLTTIQSGAFRDCTSLDNVTLPNGLISLDGFTGCTSLTSITIPSGVTKLSGTFAGCTSLSNVVLPDGLEEILSNTFYGCTSLTSVNIPDSVTAIGTNAFGACTNLSSVKLPVNWTTVAGVAGYGSYTPFRDCPKLTKMELPAGLTAIPGCAFQLMESLTEIVIPEGVTTIGNSAFDSCTGLQTIALPASLTTIESLAFEDCTALSSITFTGDAPQIADLAMNGVTATAQYPANNATWTEEVRQQYGGTITWVADAPVSTENKCGENLTWTLENGILTISGTGEMYNYNYRNDYAENSYAPWYDRRSEITGVVIGDGATTIGNYTFYGLPITSVSIGSSVAAIGSNAFESCGNLTSLTIPSSVKFVDVGAFKNCSSLNALTISDGVTRIWNSAFARCTSLAALTVPASVTHMGSYAFEGCSALKSITFLGDCPTNPPVGNTSFAAPSAVFSGVTADGYYPADNTTWIPENWTALGGNINWQESGAVCTHPTTREVLKGISYEVIDDDYHQGTEVYQQVCANPDCQAVISATYRMNELAQEQHNIVSGVCTVCEYGPLSVTVREGESSVHIGDEISATVEITGGSGTYTIVWKVKKDENVVHTAVPTAVPTFKWEPTETGSYTIVAEVAESLGGSASMSSGMIQVQAHTYDFADPVVTYEKSTTPGCHLRVETRDKVCSGCDDRVVGTPVGVDEAHANGAETYRSTHPHEYYVKCSLCGEETGKGYNFMYTTSTQSPDQCCVCHGHTWGESQYGSNIWYQVCAKCGRIQEVAAPPREETEEEVTVLPQEPAEQANDGTKWQAILTTGNWEFAEARHDTAVSADNRLSGMDEWNLMIEFCDTMEEAGFSNTFIADCYEALSRCEDEKAKEMILIMFSSDIIDLRVFDENSSTGTSQGVDSEGNIYINCNEGTCVSPDVLFHEVGHAIDAYAARLSGMEINDFRDLYTASPERAEMLKNDVEAAIREQVADDVEKLLTDEFLSMYVDDPASLRRHYTNYLTYKLLNDNIPYAQDAEEKFGIPENLFGEANDKILRDIYDNVLNEFRTGDVGGSGKKEQSVYMYCISDVLGGITNNNLLDGYGHRRDFNWYSPLYYYWYELESTAGPEYPDTVQNPGNMDEFTQDEEGNAIFNYYRIGEIWAEYVQASILGLDNPGEMIEDFFPSFEIEAQIGEMHKLLADSLLGT